MESCSIISCISLTKPKPFLAYIVHRGDKIVLVPVHVEFREDISIRAFIHNKCIRDLGSGKNQQASTVCRVDHLWTYILSVHTFQHVYDSQQWDEMPVNAT